MSKNLFFVDDSGSRVWGDSYVKELADAPPEKNEGNFGYWCRNYFVLAGVHVSGDVLRELNSVINKKKEECFGEKDVEIKSDWLRAVQQRGKHYLDPYGVHEEQLRDFVEDFWYSLFTPENFTIQAFVLDKRIFSDRSESPTTLLARLMFDTVRKYPHTINDIILDQMENSIRSRKYDQGVVSRIAASSGIFESHHSVRSVEFEDSAHSNFLQIADTVAYNVFRDFCTGRSEGGAVYSYLERILPCFYKGDEESGIYIVQV